MAISANVCSVGTSAAVLALYSRGKVRGTEDSLVCPGEAKCPLPMRRLRHHLRYTAGLSAGSHPQSCYPLSWPFSSFYSSAKPTQSGSRTSCLSASIYRKSRYFVNRSCHALPMQTQKWELSGETIFLSASIKPFEQIPQSKPTDGS